MLEDLIREEYKRQQKLPELIASQVPPKYQPFITMLTQNKKVANLKIDMTPELKEMGAWTGERGTYMTITAPYMTVEGRMLWFADVHLAAEKKYHVSSSITELCRMIEAFKGRPPADYPFTVWIDSEIYGRLEGISRIFWDGSGANETNPLENAYTSALGRAITQSGIGLIGTGFASAEEIEAAMAAAAESEQRKPTRGSMGTSPKGGAANSGRSNGAASGQNANSARPDWTAFWTTAAKDLKLDKDKVLGLAGKWKGQEVKDLIKVIKTAEDLNAFLGYLKQAVTNGAAPAPEASQETPQGTGEDIYTVGATRYETSPNQVPYIKILLLKPNGERVIAVAPQGGPMEKFEELGVGEGAHIQARLSKNGQMLQFEEGRVVA